MTETYSHSRLTSFAQCRHKYARYYFHRDSWPRAGSVEAFVGQRVHQVVEDIEKGRCPAKPSAAWEMFTGLWDEHYNAEYHIDVRRRGGDWWRDHGLRCLSNYLRVGRADPESEVLGIEYNMRWELAVSPPMRFRGILDRLVRYDLERYEIHDFKTGRKPERKWFEQDHQLPLYAQLVASSFGLPDDITITCKRIYLATGEITPYVVDHARRMESWQWAIRTAREASKFKLDYLLSLENGHAVGEKAPTTESALCDWCALKRTNECPAFRLKRSVL